MYFVGVDLAWGDRKPTGLAVLDADGRLRARLGGRHRRRDRRGARAVRRGRLPGRDRRAADRHQRHRQPAGRGGAEQGLRPLRRRRPPVQHRQAGVPRAAARRPDRGPARAGHEPALGAVAPRDRGLPAPGDGGAVPAGPDPEVQEQARPRPRAAPLRADRAGRAARGPGDRRPAARASNGTRPASGAVPPWRRCDRPWRRPTRKSELRVVEDQVDAVVCAYVALFATARARTAPRRTATSRPATSSPRRCRRTSSRRRAADGSRPEIERPRRLRRP